MKTAFLLFAASTLLSVSFTDAQCTTTDLSSISALPEFKALATSCGVADMSANPSFDAASSPFCKPDCINAIKALNKALPKCASSGLSLTATYDAALKSCGSVASPASTPSAAPAKSASADSNAVSAAVGVVAAALALARV